MNKKVRIRGNRKKLYSSIVPMHKNCRIFDEHIKFNFVSVKDSKEYFDTYFLKKLEEMRRK